MGIKEIIGSKVFSNSRFNNTFDDFRHERKIRNRTIVWDLVFIEVRFFKQRRYCRLLESWMELTRAELYIATWKFVELTASRTEGLVNLVHDQPSFDTYPKINAYGRLRLTVTGVLKAVVPNQSERLAVILCSQDDAPHTNKSPQWDQKTNIYHTVAFYSSQSWTSQS